MSDIQNPFGGAGGGYAQAVNFGSPDQPAGESADLIKDTSTAGFPTDVIQESRKQPVLVDFWAPWCGPCKQLTPIIEGAVRAAGGKVKLVKMNIDDHPTIPGQLGIQSIPAVIAFVDGKPVDGFMGAQPESKINEFIEKLTSDDREAQIEAALEMAAQAREAGDPQQAAQIYAAIVQQDARNAPALGGLADILFEAGQADQAREVLGRVPEEGRTNPAVVAVEAKMALAEQVAALGDPAELQRRLDADPKDHQARFDLAMIQNARGEREAAADNLLAIVKTDREWKDDGARAQLLQFFEAWGPTDEATLAARRRLSSLLFS
ncbi:thioredoxin [Chelativorans sp. ZYF759]|uniref:thioredoxin n=1 Tax=Chelativorans sp. ZYF759 TaxID=2692213 RepID=UPI00145DE09E|nr:thioredoxin [Chelativorans sp. ZYF759]NMG38081.1 thioredoxin [Chelativorans sp. ZYF759]